MLTVRQLCVDYGPIHAVRDVDLAVPAGGVVALLGANGAGKTTTIRAIMGQIRASRGTISLESQDLRKRRSDEIHQLGVALVPEGRQLWSTLTVEENLAMGWFARIGSQEARTRAAELYERFPVLGARRRQLAGLLSGGEQQMLSIARALMSRPKLLMMDEPSLGLAPLMVRHIFDVVAEIKETGVTILMAEQNARAAMKVASEVVVLENGRVAAKGDPETLAGSDAVQRAYLGG